MDGRKYLKVKLQHRAEWEKPSALIPAAECVGSQRGGCSEEIKHLPVPLMYAVTEEYIPALKSRNAAVALSQLAADPCRMSPQEVQNVE